MGLLGSTTLKLLQTFLYACTFCCAAGILGFYSYFLSVLASNDLPIAAKWKAIEGISGAAVIYLAFAVILTCFIGGIRIFALLAVILNLLFAAGFIAIAVLARDGVKSCSGNVETPLGNGPASSGQDLLDYQGSGFDNQSGSRNYRPDLGFACNLNKAAFALAIIGAVLFLLMIGLQLLIARKHKEDKQFQKSAGTKQRRIWQRKPRSTHPTHVESGYTTTKPEHSHHTTHHTTHHDPHVANGTGVATTTYPSTVPAGATSGYTGSNTGYGNSTTGHGVSNTGYGGSTVIPNGQSGTTYDTSGRPLSTTNPYQTGPPGPYTNY